jgi:hypothetical protein
MKSSTFALGLKDSIYWQESGVYLLTRKLPSFDIFGAAFRKSYRPIYNPLGSVPPAPGGHTTDLADRQL